MRDRLPELVRYVAVGLAVNGVLYGAYLLLTANLVGPKVAASLVYWMGIPLSFTSHRTLTFRATGDRLPQLVRFGILYVAVWGIDMAVLAVAVDRGHLPHAPVEAGLIVANAILLYGGQRGWVFRSTS